MKILHTADWHLGDRLGRIDRTADLRRAVERIADICVQENVDVLLVAGDLFSELSRPDHLRDSIRHLQEVFVPFFQGGGTLLALTGNHDNENFCQTLRHAMTLAAPVSVAPGTLLPSGRLYLAAEPTLLQLPDRQGRAVQFVLMPYPTPSCYFDGSVVRYSSLEEKNRTLQAAFTARLRALQEHDAFVGAMPTVLAAHIHVQGSQLATPFRISERETILFPASDVPAAWTYVALGHIHQPQCLRGQANVRYSGSIERLDLGERHDDKSVVLVEIDRKQHRPCVSLLPLEATPIHDLEIHDPQAELPRLRERYPDAERALVRLHLHYTTGKDNLEQLLHELDQIFPRWYARSWQEAGELTSGIGVTGAHPAARGFQDTVRDYLHAELLDHPDRAAVLELAEAFLAEDPV